MTVRSRLLLLLDLGLIGLTALLGMQVYRVGVAASADTDMAPPAASRGVQPIRHAILTSAVPVPRFVKPVPSGPSADPAFDVIAEQNLFNPNRREAEPVRPAATRLNPVDMLRPTPIEPYLYGIVLGAPGGARAYLKETATGTLLGYVIGDMVGGRVLVEIGTDRAVLRERSGELVDVFLRDPSKPKRGVRQLPVRASRPMRPVLR
jgi:hypothetical protein